MRRTLALPAALALGLGSCANNTLTGAGVGAAGGYLYDQSQRGY
jgi:hypothetical protein